jgi:hypothetical protein
MKNFDTWQDSMKEADNNLLEMHEFNYEEQPSAIVESSSEQKCTRSFIFNDSINKEIPIE